jgi:hypothetical protein
MHYLHYNIHIHIFTQYQSLSKGHNAKAYIVTISYKHLGGSQNIVLANYMYTTLTMTMSRSLKATGKVLDGRVGNRIRPRRGEVWYAQV